MPVEQAQWSEDRCTCGHGVSNHEDRGRGRCQSCDVDATYTSRVSKVCTRYQWNGEERKRVW